jgi:hypothetical protein
MYVYVYVNVNVIRCNSNSLHPTVCRWKEVRIRKGQGEKIKDSIIMNNELWVSGRGLIKLTSEMLPGGTEKSHEKPVSRPKLDPITSGIRVTKFNT